METACWPQASISPYRPHRGGGGGGQRGGGGRGRREEAGREERRKVGIGEERRNQGRRMDGGETEKSVLFQEKNPF